MKRTRVAHRKGYRRTDAELREMRERLNARTEELLAQGVAADLAIQTAKAEENARRDQEILEREVAEVLADQLMAKDVEGVEVETAEEEGEDGEVGSEVEASDGGGSGDTADNTDVTADDGDDGYDVDAQAPELTEAQEIVKKLLADSVQDGVIVDGRRTLPSLQMTWNDVDASGQGEREWDRLPTENEAWFQAFMVYLHLPPLDRGVGPAYRSWTKLVGRTRKSLKATPGEWFRAAQKYAWEVRAAAYDKTRTQRFVEKMETAEEQIEDEMQGALLLALRKCVERVKTGRLEDLNMNAAISEIPKLIDAIRRQLGIGDANKTMLDTIMQALPPQFRQQVLLYMPIGTVTIDGKGVERTYTTNSQGQPRFRAAPLEDLTLTDRSVENEIKERGLEKQLRELEAIEGELIEGQEKRE